MNLTIGSELLAFGDLLAFLSQLSVACASLGCLYLLAAAAAVLRFPRRATMRVAAATPVSVLKPLHGREPGLSGRLESLLGQHYAAPVQIICGLHDARDPAIETVKQLSAGGGSIEVKTDAREHGSNRKVSNLINMVSLARHDILVIADSDIEVGSDYLERLTAELEAPEVGAVTCPYHGVPVQGIWSRCAALGVNCHFLPNAILAIVFGLAQPCFGATIAMRRGVLAAIGGFKAFADDLADDYMIGKAVRSSGRRVAVAPFSVGHVCRHDRLGSFLAQELRAARTIRSLAPVGYVGTLISHPFPLALLAALGGAAYGIELVAIALICRLTLCFCVAHAFRLPRQPYGLIPVQDVLAFAVFIASFFGSAVRWRGFRGRVRPDGTLVADERRATS